LSLQTKRLNASFEGLNRSLAQSPSKLSSIAQLMHRHADIYLLI